MKSETHISSSYRNKLETEKEKISEKFAPLTGKKLTNRPKQNNTKVSSIPKNLLREKIQKISKNPAFISVKQTKRLHMQIIKRKDECNTVKNTVIKIAKLQKKRIKNDR